MGGAGADNDELVRAAEAALPGRGQGGEVEPVHAVEALLPGSVWGGVCVGACTSVRTRQKVRSASCAGLVYTFWPLTTQTSPPISARVLSRARSEPEPGSE